MEYAPFSFVFGCVVGALLFWGIYTIRLGSFRQHALFIVRQAESQAERGKAAFALEQNIIQNQHEQQMQEDRFRLQSQEQALKSQSQKLRDDIDRCRKDQSRLLSLQKELQDQERALSTAHQQVIATLEQTARLSYDEARSAILQKAKEETLLEIQQQTDNWQRCFASECRSRSVGLLLSALERKTQTLSKDTFLTEIPLKDRSFIPRCIGKDGRNIQTLEELLQVSFIIEEQIPRILISAHDGKARCIAKMTIERLIEDEKVTPVTIRMAHEKALSSFSHSVEEQGRGALRSCGYQKALPPDIVFTLGQLNFRSSAGQNVLKHSMEVAEMMGILAEELGLKSETAKAMGLFHDIGKGLSTEWGNSHALAGKAFLEKWGVDGDIANAVASHHGEEAPRTDEARLIPICDRLSAELPGIRHTAEPLFLSMVNQCEESTKNLPEVLSSWAHYGGNHIELVVRHAPMEQTGPLFQKIHNILLGERLPIPVNITLIAGSQSRL